MEIKFKRLLLEAVPPAYARHGDAGADLYAVEPEDVEIKPGQVVAIQTGIALEIPYGYVGLIHPRSGLAGKKAITVANAPGTVDSGYRGEILVLLTNIGTETQVISHGDRIAQLVIQKVENAAFTEVTELSDSERGEGGFGSTGGW